MWAWHGSKAQKSHAGHRQLLGDTRKGEVMQGGCSNGDLAVSRYWMVYPEHPSCDLQLDLKLPWHAAGTCNALILPRAHPRVSHAGKRLSVTPVSCLSDIKAVVRALSPMTPVPAPAHSPPVRGASASICSPRQIFPSSANPDRRSDALV